MNKRLINKLLILLAFLLSLNDFSQSTNSGEFPFKIKSIKVYNRISKTYDYYLKKSDDITKLKKYKQISCESANVVSLINSFSYVAEKPLPDNAVIPAIALLENGKELIIYFTRSGSFFMNKGLSYYGIPNPKSEKLDEFIECIWKGK